MEVMVLMMSRRAEVEGWHYIFVSERGEEVN
jgi:hypothetical protein